MQVTIYYFASLREEQGKERECIIVTEGIQILDLFVQLFGREPRGIRYAVNEEFVSGDTILQDNDQVAFIPPLGGG